ncbi:MAG: energy transducer TonB [Bacteriovoracaceae bacterium]|nr:energy transducer TonB [Bacteriovoracaceae bacterium]
MYHQTNMTNASRLFKVFLILSVAVHGGVLFYKQNRKLFYVSSQEDFPIEQSLQVRLQEALKPQITKKTEKIIKKRMVKEAVTKSAPIEEPAPEQPSKPVAKNFDSFIKNYTQPHYPRIAERRGITGKVLLTLKVKGTGEIVEAFITESSGHKSLDNSALAAIKSWSFKKLSDDPDRLFSMSKVVIYKIK